MNIRSAAGEARRHLLACVLRRPVALRKPGPLVSFAFDDFPRTAYTIGGAILRNFGARATYYVAMGLMNAVNELGESFHLEDLHSLAEDGHELASHTFRHSSSRRVSLSVFQEDARRGQRAIQEIAKLIPTSNFAYPYGEVTLAAKRALGKEMNSCRGTAGGLNGPIVDLNLLRANGLYGELNRLKSVERLILENERREGWLIFYTHDVRVKPSRYGCTPELLESTVRFATRRGVNILPIVEVLA